MTQCSPLSCTRRCHLFTRWFAEVNVGCNSTDYTASYPKRWYSSYFILFPFIVLFKYSVCGVYHIFTPFAYCVRNRVRIRVFGRISELHCFFCYVCP
jgi:hypothetical protein